MTYDKRQYAVTQAWSRSLRVRIFQYWSAIETLCDTNNCSHLLNHLFKGSRDPALQDNQKLFKDTRVLRHNVTHKGHDPSACPHTLERFLQVVFVDMLRKILNLNMKVTSNNSLSDMEFLGSRKITKKYNQLMRILNSILGQCTMN
jgi:retron-type reverse transcriptase